MQTGKPARAGFPVSQGELGDAHTQLKLRRLKCSLISAALQARSRAPVVDVVLTCVHIKPGDRAPLVSLYFWGTRSELSQRSRGEAPPETRSGGGLSKSVSCDDGAHKWSVEPGRRGSCV